MWFNNIIIFQYELPDEIDLAAILADSHLKPCPPHARFIYGWLPIYEDSFAEITSGAIMICMGKEERILPRSVILRELKERASLKEATLMRQLKRAEKAQMMEEIEFELLPKAFCLQKRVYAILDTNSKRLIINTASSTQAEQFTSFLRKTVREIKIEPFSYADNLSSQFSSWIKNPSSLPSFVSLASDCLLYSPDDEKKRVSCKGYELPADEVLSLLENGLLPSEVTINWQERIQLSITQDFVLKRVKCLDYLIDEFDELSDLDEEIERLDAALTLLIGELRQMINDLLTVTVLSEPRPSGSGVLETARSSGSEVLEIA